MADIDTDGLQREIAELRALAENIAERVAHPDDRPLYSPATLAVRLGISDRTVRELLASKDGRPPKIRSFKVADGARRIDPSAVDEYLEAQRNDG